MTKLEPTAKTENGAKAAPVVLLKTVLEPEKKPAPKAEVKTEPSKAEKPSSKTETKPEPSKTEKPAPKAETKPETAKAEKPAPKAETKPEAKAAPAKAEKPAPKAKPKAVLPKAETPAPKIEPKPEPPKAQEKPAAGPPSVECKAQVVDSPLKRMKQEFTERTNVIKQEMRNIQNSFLVIGFQLHWIKANNMYKVLNYKNIMDYAEKEFGIKKSTCCNFINIIDNYAERDENGEVIESIAECYRNFSSSQLIAMLGMPEEMQQQVTSDMSVRAIQRLRKGEPEKPAVDAPKAVISDAEPAAPAPVQETPKPAAPVPVQEAPKPAAPVSVQEAPKPAAPVPVQEAPKPAAPVPVQEVPKPVGNPAASGSVKPAENPEPKTLLEIESYSGYRSMMDKIDGMVKDVFKAGKRMKVKIICEEG